MGQSIAVSNVYLHYVLDLWFETEVKPRLRGRATLIRYAERFSTQRSRDDCGATSTTSASAATFVVCCCSFKK